MVCQIGKMAFTSGINLSPLLVVLLLIASNCSSAKEVFENETVYEALEIVGKTPTELLKLRGYKSEVYFVRTEDDYYLHLVRVINPKLKNGPVKRPVLFNHGLIESSTIYLINSRDITEAQDLSQCHKNLSHIFSTNETFYRSGPLMLANYGFDCWLLSMRGTDFSMRHETMNPLQPEFWNYSLDDFALKDIPATVKYIMKRTRAKKIGYVGHSQATLSCFALLSDKPEYSNVLEPIVMIAPVAYVHHTTSLARPVVLLLDILLHTREILGPFPPNAVQARGQLADFCRGQVIDLFCQMFYVLTGGRGEKWLKGYWSHMPFHTSIKVLRHFAQLAQSMNFQRYDHGALRNTELYNQTIPPKYQIENITSNAISLIYSETDALAKVEDINLLKQRLKVPLFRDIQIKGSHFNHFDLVTGLDADRYVFKPMLEIFETFEFTNGVCSLNESKQLVKPKKNLEPIKKVHLKPKKLKAFGQ